MPPAVETVEWLITAACTLRQLAEQFSEYARQARDQWEKAKQNGTATPGRAAALCSLPRVHMTGLLRWTENTIDALRRAHQETPRPWN